MVDIAATVVTNAMDLTVIAKLDMVVKPATVLTAIARA